MSQNIMPSGKHNSRIIVLQVLDLVSLRFICVYMYAQSFTCMFAYSFMKEHAAIPNVGV